LRFFHVFLHFFLIFFLFPLATHFAQVFFLEFRNRKLGSSVHPSVLLLDRSEVTSAVGVAVGDLVGDRVGFRVGVRVGVRVGGAVCSGSLVVEKSSANDDSSDEPDDGLRVDATGDLVGADATGDLVGADATGDLVGVGPGLLLQKEAMLPNSVHVVSLIQSALLLVRA